jgi:predicted DNA repair protein MutK
VSIGLIALLDDVAALAKVAAASLDDVLAQATKAGTKAVGVVIDDAAVTPRYVVGFAAARELPIVWRIALGSLKNKILFLLPAALGLSFLAPWLITPLLMLGGFYLCYEGAEKVFHALWPRQAHIHEDAIGAVPQDPISLENEKIRGAIQTDFILSAEVMALTLSSISASSTLLQAVILAVVGLGITILVYGGVALIVKADDVGVALAGQPRPVSALFGSRSGNEASRADRALRPLTQNAGRGLVLGMPYFLRILAVVGTAAMLWVGGGIILHGLEEFGVNWPMHIVHDMALAVAALIPVIAAAAEWFVTAALSGILGLVLGAVLIPLVQSIAAPAMRSIRGLLGIGSKKAAVEHAKS